MRGRCVRGAPRAEKVSDRQGMGFLLRVRLTSFFAGAATASLAGFYLLYKDYMTGHEAVALKVKSMQENFDERYEALNRHIASLENYKETKTSKPAETSN